MNKFAVVMPYFGCFKPSIILFLESCKRNADVDFLFFTDCPIPKDIELSKNIKWKLTSLEKVQDLAQKKLKQKVILKRAYKLCDLKPFYGIIFADYLYGYDYWGYGDVDVIYGRIMHFLTKIEYENYDKINWMGHLCFIKNIEKCNNVALSHVEGTSDAGEVLKLEKNVGFDERDYNMKCLNNQLKIYTGKWAADIDIFYPRMRCVDKKSFHFLLNMKELTYAPSNKKKQMFAMINGIAYRIYLNRRVVCYEEFAYIHFRKEVPINFEEYSRNTFIISREGFFAFNGLNESYKYIKNMIEKYNNQDNQLQEIFRFIYQYYRKITGKRGW